MFDVNEFLKVAVPPKPADTAWLEGATNAVDYVRDNSRSENVILFTNVGQAWIHSVLVPLANIDPPDFDDLQRCHAGPDSEWALEHCSGGGQPDRMYLSPPLDSPGCKSFHGGEQLVFRRQFSGVDKGFVRTELSQPLVQALGLYWLDEQSAYCRLDEDGDIEAVIRVTNMGKYTGEPRDVLVTIEAHQLHRYMAVTDTALVMKFDFTRFQPGSFAGWHNPKRSDCADHDVGYHSGVQSSCSFVNGALIVRPVLTKEMMIERSRREWNDEGKQYATFKAHDWKNNRVAEISCAPTALASYFEPESPLPFQVTPAFFKPEVLQKYKSDPEKYTLDHRSITCRGSWYLKSYDVNDAGQVHAYLCDLGGLPFKEQLYWQSFNEWPKAPISKRAIETDFEGKFTELYDPLIELKHDVSKLDEAAPDWWLPRGRDLAATVHYPISSSPDEWANAILALDQLIVEGFATKALRSRLKASNHTFDKQWQSIRLLQECLVCAGSDEDDVTELLAPLRELHHVRSKAKGHAAAEEKAGLIKKARTDHGSLAEHFRSLATGVQRSFETITQALSAETECSDTETQRK